MSDLSRFVDMSRHIGSSIASVQGGGGNTSIKLDDATMLIKASGTLLKDMTAESGYVSVNHQLVADKLEPSLSEEDASSLLSSSITDSSLGGRPSMETGFHAVLGRVVVHTHSVYVNCVSCVEDGDILSKQVLDDTSIQAEWIPYYAPGLELSCAIKARIQEKPDTQVFILQNHGVIVHADTCEEATSLHHTVESHFKRKLNLPSFPSTIALTQKTESDFQLLFPEADSLSLADVLFPDQAIYLTQNIARVEGGFSLLTHEHKANGMAETLLAKAYIETESRKANRTVTTLTDADIARILNMPSEKYRKLVIQ